MEGQRRFWRRVALLALPLTVTLGCEQTSSPSGLIPVNLGLAQVTLNPAGAWIAKEQGFFAEEGLEGSLTLIRGDTQALQALLAGSVDFIIVGSVAAIGASAEGADVVTLATLGPTMPYLLVASPEIHTPKDLAGKRIGVSGTGLAVSSAAVEIALREFGLDRKRDEIVFLPAGSASERVMGVSTGGIHATVLSVGMYPRVAELEKEGKLRILADLSKLDIRWDHCYLVTTMRYRDEHPDLVERVLKAILRAHAFILDRRNEQTVVASLTRNLGYDAEQGLTAEQIYQHVPSTIVPKPYPSREALETFVALFGEEFPNLNKVDPAKLLDDRTLRRLDRTGFIDDLYAERAVQKQGQ